MTGAKGESTWCHSSSNCKKKPWMARQKGIARGDSCWCSTTGTMGRRSLFGSGSRRAHRCLSGHYSRVAEDRPHSRQANPQGNTLEGLSRCDGDHATPHVWRLLCSTYKAFKERGIVKPSVMKSHCAAGSTGSSCSHPHHEGCILPNPETTEE
jgi:hypothetical protein